MKEYDVEFSATVKVKAEGDTDAIMKVAFVEFMKQVKHDFRKKKNMMEKFTATILHEHKDI